MKRLLIFGLMLVFLTACGSKEPPYTDNGNPGQIRAVFFFDDNKNGKMDDGETAVQAQAIVAISQEVSCPPTGEPDFVDTNINGIHEFTDLKPGKYCLALSNGFTPITKLTQEVYVSSDMVTTAYFGIAKQP